MRFLSGLGTGLRLSPMGSQIIFSDDFTPHPCVLSIEGNSAWRKGRRNDFFCSIPGTFVFTKPRTGAKTVVR